MPFRINRVFTRSGDGGMTGLADGTRVSKSDPRIDALGELDELNSVCGIIIEYIPAALISLKPVLHEIQQTLFDLGAQIATPGAKEGQLRIRPEEVDGMESLCRRFSEGLPELTSFILPGGSQCAAYLHLARSVCRRAERSCVKLLEANSLDGEAIRYLNRLSDLFFILARWTLREEGREIPLWDSGRKAS